MDDIRFVAVALAATQAPVYASPSEPQQQHQQRDPQQHQQDGEQQQGQQHPQQQHADTEQPQLSEDSFEYESSSGPRLGIMVTGLSPELRSFYGVVATVAPWSDESRRIPQLRAQDWPWETSSWRCRTRRSPTPTM